MDKPPCTLFVHVRCTEAPFSFYLLFPSPSFNPCLDQRPLSATLPTSTRESQYIGGWSLFWSQTPPSSPSAELGVWTVRRGAGVKGPSSRLLGRQIDGVNASASRNFAEFQFWLKEMMHITSLMMFTLQDICVYYNLILYTHTHTHIAGWDWPPELLGIMLLRGLSLPSLSNLYKSFLHSFVWSLIQQAMCWVCLCSRHWLYIW